MSTNISSMSPSPSWEGIKEAALKNENLTSDIRVSDGAVQVNQPGVWQRFKVTCGLEKAPVYASREETAANLQDHFDAYFSKELCRLVAETGIHTDEVQYMELVTGAMQQSKIITQKLTTTIATPAVSTSQAIQEAHEGGLNSLTLLRQQIATPQLTPQFCVTKEGKISVLQPAPHPENFLLSGGGVKGAGYVGWFKAAEQFGVLKNLKRIAGSSAGAMAAALIASGMNVEDFKKVNDRTSFWSMLTGTSHNPVINAATQLEKKGWLSYISFSGTYAVDRINQEMVGSIKKYFDEFKTKDAFTKKTEELQAGNSISTKEKQALENLHQKIASPPLHWLFGSLFQKKQPTYMVTFQDLAALAKMDSRFKELTVTGYVAAKKEERYFNAQNTPDVKIAEAVRGSMALPGAFNPVIIEGEEIIDGGVASNTPAEVFKGYPQSTTLVLQFENDGRFNQTVYSIKDDQKAQGIEGLIEEGIAQVEEKVEEEVTGNSDFGKRTQSDREKLYEAGPNAMMVGEGDLGTVSFMASQERIHQAQRQAEIRAAEAFSLRQDQAVDHVFNSLDEAMNGMSSAELKNIIDFYDFKPPQYDPDYSKKARQGDPLPLSTEARRAMSQILSKDDRYDIVQAAEKELAARSQRELALS